MATQQYDVEVQPDFLKKITGAKPVQALAELIWNGLDADASDIGVFFNYNELDTLSEVVIRDNGTGIARDKAPEYFRRLGGSWKRPGALSKKGRFLHGQEGRGRFKAFAVGDFAEWAVAYEKNGCSWVYTIKMSASDIRHVSISDEVKSPGAPYGVKLTISEPHKDFTTFVSQAGLHSLTEIFALYLADYPDVHVAVGGHRIDPKAVIVSRKTFDLADINTGSTIHPARLEIVEWRGISNRALFLCNEKRFPLAQADRRFHVGDFQFTAYLESSYLSALQKDATVELAEMQPPMVAAIDDSVVAIKEYFRGRAAATARGYVEEWKAEQVYPFSEEPKTQVEQVERQVFDIVAVNVAQHLPDFEKGQTQNKAFHLRMLRQAIEKSPEELQLILSEVLKLPKRKQEELADLLRDVSLSAIISSAKIVADRLRFLTGLEAILFDAEPKKRLKERSQLHRIIAQNTWLFGEEFSLSVDDQSLTEVLRKHKKILCEGIVIDAPVKHISQERGIVDLMLSRAMRTHRANSLSHLVVELKAPTVKLDRNEISQIEGYAASVVADERFRNIDVQWQFWAISDDLGAVGKFRVGKGDGQIMRHDNIAVYLKTWAQVIDENRARLQFFQEKLEYQADKGASLKFLQERYAKYLEGVLDDSAALEQ
ncbi:ATP-binding protein [Nevskia sp.]|uniref:ATP-binding protein n=1 Tax=Nevskia sp. TaxID=1929292 RepID=UPI0025CCA026|nr:ATP-binding protein [Nevskia sp.]